MYLVFYFSLLLIVILPIPSFALNTIQLTDNKGRYDILPDIEILEDREKSLTINDMANPAISKRFSPNKHGTPTFGLTNSAYWLRFNVKNNSTINQIFYIEVSYVFIEKIVLFYQKTDTIHIQESTGIAIERKIKYKYFVIPIEITDKNTHTVYMRFETGYSLSIPIVLWSKEAFYWAALIDESLNGLYFGVLLALILYNCFIFVSVHDLAYLYYILYTACMAIYQLAYYGYTYITPATKKIFFYETNLNVIFLLIIFGLLFTKSFLKTKQYSPKIDKLTTYMIFITIVLMPCVYFIPRHVYLSIERLLAILAGLILIVASTSCYFAGYKAARYFILSWLFFIVFMTMRTLTVIGIMPFNFITDHGMQIGSAMEVILFSFALADRINILNASVKQYSYALEKKVVEHRNMETKYRSLMEQSSEAIMLLDTKGIIIEINKQAETLFGLKDGDKPLKNICYKSFIPQDEHKIWKKYILTIIKTGSILIDDVRVVDNNGSTVLVDITVNTIEYTGNTFYQATVRDIANRKKMEENLRKTQKLEAIGILAGGIAHDFNNILTALSIRVHYCLKRLSPENRLFQVLKESEGIFLMAKGLSQQLLTFSKGGVPIKRVVFIEKFLADIVKMSLSGTNISYEISVTKNILPVNIDEGQIMQVITNILINAVQAMQSGGFVYIAVENVIIDSKTLMPVQAGQYVLVSVRDTGYGITSENIKHIFDPFFTTKENGSGLGLSISYSIIKKHNGYIDVESEVGKGTVFKVYLPAYEKATRVFAIDTDINIYDEKTKPTISAMKLLIMDDDDNINEFVGKLLQEEGYTVEVAKEGRQAIEKYKNAMENKTPFNIVIIDLTIRHGMGGKITIEELIKIDPTVKAVVTSGYSNEPIIAEFQQFGFKGVITKPYNIDELKEVLHRLSNFYR
ncbi:MAG: ATP-binding protein [Candidatus Magnetoovum sp. WYHC-5]|nr:ATP-binding protein [Candidatus Magnetoovum sp. WYHC-5]